jgi:amidase/nitrilase
VPAGVYLQEPVFDRETILYAELDADDRRHTKAYFDALGHYARFDVLRLELRGEPLEPLIKSGKIKLDPSMLKLLAEKYGVQLKKLEKILEELGIGSSIS